MQLVTLNFNHTIGPDDQRATNIFILEVLFLGRDVINTIVFLTVSTDESGLAESQDVLQDQDST